MGACYVQPRETCDIHASVSRSERFRYQPFNKELHRNGLKSSTSKHFFLHTINKIICCSQNTPAYDKIPKYTIATNARTESIMEVYDYLRNIYTYHLYRLRIVLSFLLPLDVLLVYCCSSRSQRNAEKYETVDYILFGEDDRLIVPGSVLTKC